jgi:predicted NBD/HSP70 family sugar kinase
VRNDRAASNFEDVRRSGMILSLIASGRAKSRADLQAQTGLSRSTIAQRLEVLASAGLVREADAMVRSGGRPARVVRLNPEAGIVLVAVLGRANVRLAITDLEPKILVEATCCIEVEAGPIAVLGQIVADLSALLCHVGRPPRDIVGMGLGLPAPVDFAAGRVSGPSTMTGWDGFDSRGWLEAAVEAPVVIESSVNLMALFEARRFWPDVDHLLVVKAGTDISGAIVIGGRIFRGARGAAGDIGHVRVDSEDSPLCRCGKLGCVNARAGGWAIARDLAAEGVPAQTARDVVRLVQNGQPEAVNRIRRAGHVIGNVVADVVRILDPELVVVGGTLSAVDKYLLPGIGQSVLDRSPRLATREPRVVCARSRPNGSLLGGAQLVIDTQTKPESIERTIARYMRSHKAMS